MDLLLRRRMMMAQSAGDNPDYIASGLVFWLDGINKGANAGSWTDLIGGKIFTPNGAVAVSTGWETGNGKKLTNSEALSFPATSGTIEVALTRQGAMGGAQTDVVSFLDSQSLIITYDGNNLYWSRINSSSTGAWACTVPGANPNAPYCISANGDRAVVNGVSYTTARAGGIGAQTSNAIGSRGIGSYYMTGIVHSVRIYNRRLTEAEMKHNQEIDNTRFNLGLSL